MIADMLTQQILDISYRHKLSHVSSNIEIAPILDGIYYQMASTAGICILSAGHAGLALYCVTEKHGGGNAEQMLNDWGAQPHLCPARGVHCSTGSLGQGLTVAVGYAMADRPRHVHCVITDGECAEGCVWECLAFIHDHGLTNLTVHVAMNGRTALAHIDTERLERRLRAFLPAVRVYDVTQATSKYEWLSGIWGHYRSISDADYHEATK